MGRGFFLAVSAVSLVATISAWVRPWETLLGPSAILMLASMAIYFHLHPTLKVLTFTFWVFTSVATALFYPSTFLSWGGVELRRLNVPLIQIIMFGMGSSLSMADFGRALRMPKAVLLGILLQFTVMPLTGWSIAHVFGFDPKVAAGVILIGACSGGVASNVMAFLARANVALSVTMTACSTLLAPVMTPLAMKILAGRLVPIPFLDMMISIIKMVILPIAAGLVANYLLHGRRRWLDRGLPVLSMASICFIISIIIANSRDKLVAIGLVLIVAALLHNLIGYFLGYGASRLIGLAQTDCRTVAFEVGMQNGGMATGLAIDVLRSTDAALAPVIFGVWMNVSGSTLASWWRERAGPGAGKSNGSRSDTIGEAQTIAT